MVTALVDLERLFLLHRELNLMRLSFPATHLPNLDLPDAKFSMGRFYVIATASFFSL